MFELIGLSVGLVIGDYRLDNVRMALLSGLWVWCGISGAAAVEAIVHEQLRDTRGLEFDERLRGQYLRGALFTVAFAVIYILNNAREEEPSDLAAIWAVLPVVVYMHLGYLSKHRLFRRAPN
jgi:hypothetical protein